MLKLVRNYFEFCHVVLEQISFKLIFSSILALVASLFNGVEPFVQC